MSHLGVGFSGANLIPKSRLFPHRCRRCRFTANAKFQRFQDAPNLPLSHNLPDKPHIRPKLDGFSRTCSRFGDKFSGGGEGKKPDGKHQCATPLSLSALLNSFQFHKPLKPSSWAKKMQHILIQNDQNWCKM